MIQPVHELKNLQFIRWAFLKTIESFSVEKLNRIPKGFNNNIIWNFAHSIVSTQSMCYNSTGNSHGVSKEFVNKYKRGTKPEAAVTEDEINYWKELAISSISQMENDFEAGLFNTYNPWNISKRTSIDSIEDALNFSYFHEGTHFGYVMAMKNVL